MSNKFLNKEFYKKAKADYRSLTVRDWEEFQCELEDRVGCIMESIYKSRNRRLGWWSWEYYEGEYSEPPSFSFSSNINDGYVRFYSCDDRSHYNPIDYLDDEGGLYDIQEAFPESWLFDEDFESKMKSGINAGIEAEKKKKAKAKAQRDSKKKKEKEAADAVLSKLTPAEKKLLKKALR